ncbi:hypothetical protein E2C01_063649 [Portunus trituberculatus]|uniref:Uncharacterized protein n=1 Tax=Portunus trituberculatus TaxID=210409 RepID=A0A5B7HLG7_PORTR|nr:hypothetical protein [Portunus trituberculatus]
MWHEKPVGVPNSSTSSDCISIPFPLYTQQHMRSVISPRQHIPALRMLCEVPLQPTAAPLPAHSQSVVPHGPVPPAAPQSSYAQPPAQ